MLRRKMIEYLVNWKNTKNEECLVVKGARQVGKTYIIREFGKTYKNFIEINFLLNKSAKTAFAGDLLVDDILMSLSANVKDVKFVPKETLIFLDEIQACPEARTALKSFAIDGRYKDDDYCRMVDIYSQALNNAVNKKELLKISPKNMTGNY